MQNQQDSKKTIKEMLFEGAEVKRRTALLYPGRYLKILQNSYGRISKVKEQLTGAIIYYRVGIDFHSAAKLMFAFSSFC